ncbi:hypothetical protein BGZ65_008324 [Modicella reniformis]|uniref:(d)CMP kinase n=1 Tax=Modicella reniformis TaxID=1440133 RepID=A0A9P6IPS3_9FUNG|nr:hypothetical protein BGZ65_008324 [Modicella reniformis]
MFKRLVIQLQAPRMRTFSIATRTKPFQVAIDGPAASGKSTTAKMVAQRLGFDYIDSGAFYRCITLAALSKGINPSDPATVGQISEIAEQCKIGLQTVFAKPSETVSSGEEGVFQKLTCLPTTRVFLNSKDVSSEIRSNNVSQHVSAVAAIRNVREAVLQKIRSIRARENNNNNNNNNNKQDSDNTPNLSSSQSQSIVVSEGLVMDGRDIGTVILPHADLKIFLVADSRIRAERRLQELVKNGLDPTLNKLDVDTVQRDLQRRDELDRTRKVSPLRKADDAMVLDTSNLTIEGQVDVIVQEVERRRGDNVKVV